MRRPPRPVDRPILDGFAVWRIIFVGLALLGLTLWAFFWMKSTGASDELAAIEVAPMYDPTGQTALNAANLLFEMLCVVADSRAVWKPISA